MHYTDYNNLTIEFHYNTKYQSSRLVASLSAFVWNSQHIYPQIGFIQLVRLPLHW